MQEMDSKLRECAASARADTEKSVACQRTSNAYYVVTFHGRDRPVICTTLHISLFKYNK